MLNLSPQRLIDLWHQLEQCWDRENNYGSDTAEIYVYTICDCRPVMWAGNPKPTDEAVISSGKQAAVNLYHVITMFREKRKCDVLIDDRKFGDWLLNETLYHRCHVKIIPECAMI